jgi:hypothetical protein
MAQGVTEEKTCLTSGLGSIHHYYNCKATPATIRGQMEVIRKQVTIVSAIQ